jgi:hypothetical protein
MREPNDVFPSTGRPRRRRLQGLVGVGAGLLIVGTTLVGTASPAAGHQHGTDEGHLLGTGEEGKIEFVGKVEVSGAGPELIADVAVDPDGDFAYLANWGSPDCPLLEDVPGNEAGGRKASDAGVWVVDISDLDNPEEVAFIPMSQDTRPGEGLQVIHIETAEFTGDVLAVNEESCGKNFKAGFSLWDVTDPANPVKLAKNFGDFTTDGGRNTPRDANQSHSVFMWTTGENAYLVAQDEMETSDVDIFDITDPKHPILIAEVDANDFDVDQPDIFLTASFLHDVVVKEIDGRWIMLLSYWDGGWVLLDVTDPANPEFIADTDYEAVDPLLLEELGVALPPEGNAHQAEFTIDNRFIIGTDEDFSPFKLFMSIAGGDEVPVSAGTATPVDEDVYIGPGETLTAPTTFLGTACGTIAPATTDPAIAVVERGGCFFQVKIDNVTAAGYDAIMIFNNETGDPPCEALIGMLADTEIPAYFVSRSVGYAILGIEGYDPANCPGGANPALPAVGTAGETLTLSSQFDAWGYVHLIDAETLEDVDQFAIPEALDPAFAEGFGDLSVHEVAVDPQDASLAYLSYYSGGLVAVQIQCPAGTPYDPDNPPADTSTCELVEVGSYLDPAGNNFWGVETFVDENPDSPYFGRTVILASDRDSGLWIFVDP